MRCYFKRSSDPDAAATAKVDAPVLRYRVYANRVRRVLLLGGVLQEHARSVGRSYATGLLVIVMCFSQFVFVMSFCRDHTDNLVLASKCLGLASSFIAPVLMVSRAIRALYICRTCCLSGRIIRLTRSFYSARSTAAIYMQLLNYFGQCSRFYAIRTSVARRELLWKKEARLKSASNPTPN